MKVTDLANSPLEARLQAAVEYLENYSDSKVAKVAREFDEKALCRYIDRLDNINLAVRKEFIQDTADCIWKARASKNNRNLPQVGSKWVGRFIKRVLPSKVLDANRQASENVEILNEYFQKLKAVIEANGIVPEDIWNMDETGFQIGVGKDQLVVTRSRQAQYFGLPVNRESATAIEAVSGASVTG
ncbi:transposase [Metarhizium guizhouense ARSEF 977]|uniref:Transposase n=1 Tax=Metarhizium guizhouense (strain ARSEF 977) TaxID=1276136 RepID=A0A0B4HNR6_METGA|nr:transposase [Metarhizium guizhouense ARSEF 977]